MRSAKVRQKLAAALAVPVALTASVTVLARPAEAVISAPVGTVISAAPLDPSIVIPGASRGLRLVYVSTDVHGAKAYTSGELFLPAAAAPVGGYRVISWAHGTSGLADDCAPSLVGPAEPQRDFPYLAKWLQQGYAIVASDYAGLGTPGLPAYLNGLSEAHNVVDMVTAARAYARAHLASSQQLSNRWVTIGQSQGGGASIYTARYATAFGGSNLQYLGAVGTGVPAYIEDYVSLLGPELLAPDPTGDLGAYLAYIVRSLDATYPALGIDQALTAEGKKWMQLAETECVFPLADKIKSSRTLIGSWFTKPLAILPNWTPTVDAYMKMPESGFDKPFFMGHGLLDTDVPYAATAVYAAALKSHKQPVTFKTYLADHSGTLVKAEADEIPYVANLFAAH